jgi:glucan 1,3-beta-glucosidase
LTIVDSTFNNVKQVVLVPRGDKFLPNIVIDNLKGNNIGSGVTQVGGGELLRGGPVEQWALGWRVTDQDENGRATYGPVVPQPRKPNNLLSDGKFFTRSKPQYEDESKVKILSVLWFGAKNDGKTSSASQNTKSINLALSSSAETNSVIVFPAGIYLVDDTLLLPVGARIQGALWSQIMAVGPKFGNPKKPRTLVQ